jgi:Protein of unknown function (DUF2380)
MRNAALLMLTILAFSLPRQAAHAAPPALSVAVLDFELIDTSLEGASRGVDAAETQRLKLVSDKLRELLAASGKYQVVDIAPAAAKIADAGSFHGCNGCDTAIGATLGAERVVTGAVQKISTLILILTIVERDVASGRDLQIATAQIRGDTDQSWTRGVEWLVRNRLLAGQ